MQDYKKSAFIPDWIDEPPKKGSYRSIFKWGDPKGFKHPNKRLYDHLKEALELTDNDFKKRKNEGHEKVVCDNPIGLDQVHIEAIKAIVGPDNVTQDGYSRVKYSSGMTMIEVNTLRKKGNESVADIVVHPRDKEDVQRIKDLCDRYYKNPPIEYDDILNAHLHSIYLINIDKGFAKELDPQGYVDLTNDLLERSEVKY